MSEAPDPPKTARSRRRPVRRRRVRLVWAGSAVLLLLIVTLPLVFRRPALSAHVAAVVGGREITFQDLEAEARAEGLAYRSDLAPRLLQTVVTRVLLAQAARRERLDKQPTFPADRVRVVDELLASRMAERVGAGAGAGAGDAAAVRRLIATRAAAFDDRSQLTLRQVRFSMPDTPDARELASLPTLDDVTGRLAAMGVRFRRGTSVVDSADLAPDLARSLLDLDEGGMMLTRQGDDVVATEVIDEVALDASPEERFALAAALLKREKGAEAMAREVARLHAGARIVYRPGLKPSPLVASPREEAVVPAQSLHAPLSGEPG